MRILIWFVSLCFMEHFGIPKDALFYHGYPFYGIIGAFCFMSDVVEFMRNIDQC